MSRAPRGNQTEMAGAKAVISQVVRELSVPPLSKVDMEDAHGVYVCQ